MKRPVRTDGVQRPLSAIAAVRADLTIGTPRHESVIGLFAAIAAGGRTNADGQKAVVGLNDPHEGELRLYGVQGSHGSGEVASATRPADVGSPWNLQPNSHCETAATPINPSASANGVLQTIPKF